MAAASESDPSVHIHVAPDRANTLYMIEELREQEKRIHAEIDRLTHLLDALAKDQSPTKEEPDQHTASKV